MGFFSLITFSTLYLLCMLSVSTMICHRELLFWSCLFGLLCVSCVCMGMSFHSLGTFSMLKSWTMLLTWDSSLSFMPIIQKFNFFTVPEFSVCSFSVLSLLIHLAWLFGLDLCFIFET